MQVSGERKAIGSDAELGNVVHPKFVAFEIGDGSEEENVALRSGNGRVNAGKLCLRSDCPEKTLTVFGLSELEMMARAKAGELGLGSHVVSSDGRVRVQTVCSFGGLPAPDVGAVRTKYYPSHSAKNLFEGFF